MQANTATISSQKSADTAVDYKRLPLADTRGQAIINVTPDIAKSWLEYNTANRVLVRDVLNRYMHDMENGKWLDNGESIKFSKGKLLDGQHRLEAIVRSGIAIPVSVEFGLRPDSQDTMDTGRHRTPRDVLSIEGLGPWESRTLGSAIHTMIEVDRGGVIYTTNKHSNASARAYYLEHYAAIEKSLRTIRAIGRHKSLMPSSLALVMHYIFSRKSEETADLFFEKLFVGEDLSRDSAIFHIRNKFLSYAINRNRRSNYERIGMIVKAWNSFHAGRQMKSDSALYLKAGDAFPEIK